MALGLVGVTAWFAWETRNDARSARNQLDLYQRQAGASGVDAASLQAKENQILMQQMAGKGQTAPPPAGTPELPLSARVSSKINLAHVGQAALDAPPPPLSPRQR